MKNIAVIGSGISGHVAAHRLKSMCSVTLYEAEDRFGGHANTVTAIDDLGQSVPVDTGFIVFNHDTYPGFTGLMSELGVETRETDMSFGCRDDKTGLEYSTKNLNGLFAQRSNLLKPSYWQIWKDFFKFRSHAKFFAQHHPNDSDTTLGELVREAGCSKNFWQSFLYPMAGAIWSTAPQEMESYPARSFLQFMINHRMLEPQGQPIWRTVVGGSQQYVKALAQIEGIRRWKNSPVTSVKRLSNGVVVTATGRPPQVYDEVIIATHSYQALNMLENPSSQEKRVLSQINYQPNLAILHNDVQSMPVEKRAWAAWNVRLPMNPKDRVELTYDMNRLQHLKGGPWLVTLNPSETIEDRYIHKVNQYSHPFFDCGTLKAQDQWSSISGTDRIHYCGAYWKWGFHEDGLWSAMRVVQQIKNQWLEDLMEEPQAANLATAVP